MSTKVKMSAKMHLTEEAGAQSVLRTTLKSENSPRFPLFLAVNLLIFE